MPTTTTLYLDDRTKAGLEFLASWEGRSRSAMMRELIRDRLAKTRNQMVFEKVQDPDPATQEGN